MYKEYTLEQLVKAKKISQNTYDKVKIAKEYIERKYNLKTIKNLQINSIAERLNALNIPQEEKDKILNELYNKESQKIRKKREKLTVRDYESIQIIGRGAFGEVRVCRHKETGEIVAIKKIRKDVLVAKNQILHTRNEQQFLSKVKSPWIVDLKASFQEGDYLFLIMEFLPGGDMMNLLIAKDIFTEYEAKFYTAELILAVESIHKLDCIHRDIKPDNILIGKDGHIKLSDFGLAKVSEKIFDKAAQQNILTDDKRTHEKNFSCVGTANYVAPEVLCKKGYGPEVDWWSVGVIFYEMLCGYAPFCSKETSQVCSKILNWEKYLQIPRKAKMSKEARDLIYKMVNNPSIRLGKNGSTEIKKHPFFKEIDWENIRSQKAPFIPKIKSDYDTAYFEVLKEKEDDPFYPIIKKGQRKEIEYIGYTYKSDEENEDNVNWVADCLGAEVLEIDYDSDWGITEEEVGYHFYPHNVQGEGLYMCALRKQEDTFGEFRIKESKRPSANNSEFEKEMRQWLSSPDDWAIRQSDRFMTAYPMKYKALIDYLGTFLTCISTGFGIGELRGKGVVPQHSLSMSKALKRDAFPNIELDLTQALCYLRTEALPLQQRVPLGRHLLTYQQIPLGFVKNVGNRLNNLYPNEWRIRNL